MDEVHIATSDAASEIDLGKIDAGLHAFNTQAARLDEIRLLVCLAKLPDGTLVGGVKARTWGACCEVLHLWVDDEHRRRGIGRRLMEATELEAVRRGCTLIYLDTFSFQAPGFYERLGFEIVAEFRGFPHGVCRFMLRKLVR
jgi:GNAT superfamily N-acetyltransferase